MSTTEILVFTLKTHLREKVVPGNTFQFTKGNDTHYLSTIYGLESMNVIFWLPVIIFE